MMEIYCEMLNDLLDPTKLNLDVQVQGPAAGCCWANQQGFHRQRHSQRRQLHYRIILLYHAACCLPAAAAAYSSAACNCLLLCTPLLAGA